MIAFDKFTLNNGLRVLVHTDDSTPMVALNIMYDVGAKDENITQTGFAHLFEHLMFGGSINVPEYDEPLQMAGGENNAYTTNDLTNYYITLPKENMETAFWLESDRMLSLAFSKKSLDVQRKVVCEEFKEHYLNKPYGDVWHLLRPEAYTTHPYQWMTIGKELKHIEDATLEDVKAFFFKHYTPCNAIMCVAGNVTAPEVKALAEKWFGNIPSGELYNRVLPTEPKQTAPRRITVERNIPVNALYKAYHMPGRMDQGYYEADFITEILSGGQSSRLYQQLVKEKQLFSSIDCYHFGTVEPGLLVIEGKVLDHVSIETAEAAIEELLTTFVRDSVSESELEKAKNKTESILAFEDMSLLNRANNLAFYELMGNANLMNTEWDNYSAVTTDRIKNWATIILDKNNCTTLHYLKVNP
jgi:zinc protease